MITDYNQLPIGKYLRIMEVVNQDLEDLDKQVKVLSILYDIAEEDILHLPINEYKALVFASQFLEDKDKNPQQAAREYYLGKWVLVPTFDYRKLETAQYVDFQTFAPHADTHMVELLSCLMVPKGHRYNEGYDIADVQDVIREELSTTDAFALVAFFLLSLKTLIKDTLNSCQATLKRLPKEEAKRMQKQIAELQMILRGNGDGLRM